jgi:hypothetical protein
VAELERACGKLRSEVAERDVVIGDNYGTIQGLRRRLQDLEKHKFVLGYKVGGWWQGGRWISWTDCCAGAAAGIGHKVTPEHCDCAALGLGWEQQQQMRSTTRHAASTQPAMLHCLTNRSSVYM